MKNTLKFPMMLGCMILFLGACESNYSFGSQQSLADILETYSNHPNGVGFTIATNQPSSSVLPLGPPTTWAKSRLTIVPQSNPDPNGTITIGGFVLRSPATGTRRYWSDEQDDNFDPFDPAQRDLVMLEIRVTGNDHVQINLYKEENDGSITNFSVEIYGYLAGAEGHLIYGKYGGFNGLITISLWEDLPVAG